MILKLRKGFSLAEILQTIFIVGIIAGVSLSFFRQHEPDKRIYNATVKQLQQAIAAVAQQACSDTFVCYREVTDASDNVIAYSYVTLNDGNCPRYAVANDSSYSVAYNGCIHASDADATCTIGGAGWTLNADGSLCVHIPNCNNPTCPNYNGTLVAQVGGSCSIAQDPAIGCPSPWSIDAANPANCIAGTTNIYRDHFCFNGNPQLNSIVHADGVAQDITFFCDKMYDILSKNTNTNKQTICTSNSEPLKLTNRARIYNLGTGGNNFPVVLVIKYDNPNNILYGNQDLASLSYDNADVMFVFPNGKVVTREEVINEIKSTLPSTNEDITRINEEASGSLGDYNHALAELNAAQQAKDGLSDNAGEEDVIATNDRLKAANTSFSNIDQDKDSAQKSMYSALGIEGFQGHEFKPIQRNGTYSIGTFLTNALRSACTTACGDDGGKCKTASSDAFLDLNEFSSVVGE